MAAVMEAWLAESKVKTMGVPVAAQRVHWMVDQRDSTTVLKTVE